MWCSRARLEPQRLSSTASCSFSEGILISRPGVRIGMGLEQGIPPGTLEAAQFAGRPLVIALFLSLVLAAIMKETYPKAAEK